MIGYIHRLLFSLIESTGGVEALAEIKLHAGIPEDRYFAMNEVSCDEEWQRQLGATCELLVLQRYILVWSLSKMGTVLVSLRAGTVPISASFSKGCKKGDRHVCARTSLRLRQSTSCSVALRTQDMVVNTLNNFQLLKSSVVVLGLSVEEAEEVFADCFCKDALARWPVCFQTSKTARDLLEKQPVIHDRFASGLRDPEQRAAVEKNSVWIPRMKSWWCTTFSRTDYAVSTNASPNGFSTITESTP